MKKTGLTIFILLSVVAFACTAKQPEPSGGEKKTGEGGGETIAVFTKNQTNPFFNTVRVAAESAGKQMNVKVIQYVPTKPDDIPEQMNQVEDAIVKHPDAVVFIPVDSAAMVPGIEKLNTAKIPVINITDRVAGGNMVTFMGCDELNLALNTGRYLLDKLGGKGNVVILEGVGGSLNSANRVSGYKKALAEFPNVKLVASQPGNFQRKKALEVMENLMQTYPKIDGVLAANDAMALGAIEALDGAKRKALVVGLNGTKEAIDAIKTGTLLASGDCDGFLHGCLGTMAAVRHLRNLPVPPEHIFALQVIDKSNYTPLDVPLEQRMCPTWESLVKN